MALSGPLSTAAAASPSPDPVDPASGPSATVPASNGGETWPILEMRTAFALEHDLLDRLGIEVRGLDATGDELEHHPLSISKGRDVAFASSVGPSLGLHVVGGQPAGFTGTVRHRGGFVLDWGDDELDLRGFQLRGGQQHLGLEILDAAGELVLRGDHMHHDLGSGNSSRFRAFNMDLRIAPALAERLGEPGLEGFWLGTLALEAELARSTLLPGGGGGEPSCLDWTGEIDVALTAIDDVNNMRQQDGRVVIAPSATLRNVGTANAPWYEKFSGNHPPYDNDQHPFLIWGFYRLADGRLEQLATSDIKHAFLTLNIGCDPEACTDPHILGLGCADIYGSGTNNQPSVLSFRDEVQAAKGLWQSTGSHFDPNAVGSQTHPPQNQDGPFDHRSWVFEEQLETPGARYFMAAWYLVRDDIDIFNSMGYREVQPQRFSGTWFFSTTGTFETGSVLDAWVDPDTPEEGSSNTTAALGGSHVQLAVRTTRVGIGLFRYEYVLRNHDFDRQIRSLQIPLDGATVISTEFRDLDDEPANDWQASIGPDRVSWNLPANAPTSPRHSGGVGLDWGLSYSFSIVARSEPTVGDAIAIALEPGPSPGVLMETLAPGPSSLLFGDDFESGTLEAWGQ